MNRTMWILLVLIAALAIATIWRDQQGLPAPSYTLCKGLGNTNIYRCLHIKASKPKSTILTHYPDQMPPIWYVGLSGCRVRWVT